MSRSASFAVVVPFFDEEQNVRAVCLELREVLQEQLSGGEVILVDDGSCDRTGEILCDLAAEWPECRVYHLQENEGQSAALLFGFSKTTAPVIVTMDGDGQNDPGDIPKLLARLKDADMVVGYRVVRHDSWARRNISRIANLIRSEWLRDGISDAGCALKVFRREVADAFIPIRTLYSFMPALAVAAGFQVVEEPVTHRPRVHGVSRYTVRSFLLLPVIDFIGLGWFQSRRCRANISGSSVRRLGSRSLGDGLYRRLFLLWLKRISWAAVAVLLIAIWVLSPSRLTTVYPARKIGLLKAERIAVCKVPNGQISTEELRMEAGHLAWLIDVRPRGSKVIDEIQIDATDGHIIGTLSESPEEEQLELAAEDHQLDPKRHVPR